MRAFTGIVRIAALLGWMLVMFAVPSPSGVLGVLLDEWALIGLGGSLGDFVSLGLFLIFWNLLTLYVVTRNAEYWEV